MPAQLPEFEHLFLPRLSEGDVKALTVAMLGTPSVDSNLIQLLYRETEGNVLFLIESIRALAEESGRLTEIGKTGLPASIRAEGVDALLAKRLERVPEEARQLLSFAAVLGRKLEPALLQHEWNGEMSWEQWLLALSNAAIIHMLDGQQWAFAHNKLREIVLADLSPRRACELHARAAQVIEAVYPDSPVYYWKLASHWRDAQHFDREFEYLSLAGMHLLRTSSYREAVECYQRGLDLIHTSVVSATEEKQAEFLTKQGAALASLGEYEMSNQVFQAVLAFSQEHDLEKGVADGFHGLAKNNDVLGNYQDAQNYYGLALAIYEKLKDAKSAARTRMGLGRVAFRLSAFEEARLAFQSSLEIFRRLDDHQGTGSVLSGLGDTARAQGDYGLAKQFYLEALEVYQTIGNRDGTSMAYNNLGVLAETQGLCEEAISWHQQSLEIKREIGSRQGIAISLSNIGIVYYALNDFETARQYVEETTTLYRALNDRQGMADAYNNLGLIDLRMKNYPLASERLSKALQLFEQVGDQWGVALAQLNLGKVARELLAYSTAAHHFLEAIEIAQILKLDAVCLQTVVEHAPIILQTGDPAQAVVHLACAAQNTKTPALERSYAQELLEEARKKLSPVQFDEAFAIGTRTSLEDLLSRDFTRLQV